MARESLETPSLAKLKFFIQRCCEPVYLSICSAKTSILKSCSQTGYFFKRLNCFDCKKRIMQLLSV